MKVSRFLLLSLIGLALLSVAGSAQAAYMVTQGAVSGGVSTQVTSVPLPPDLMVAVYCNEFKWRAGKAITQIQAAHEVMDAKLSEFDALGGNFRLKDYVDEPSGLVSQVDGVCAAETVEEAQAKIDSFRSAAERVRGQFVNIGSRIKADLEKYIAENEEHIRASMEKELRAELSDLEAEARARLEAQLRAEAEQRKNEIRSRIQKKVKAELIAEYGGQKNPDIDFLMKLGEERGRARGKSEGTAVEAELRTKYEALAEQEVEKLKAAGEERAKEKEAEMRERMQAWVNVSTEISALAQQKYEQDWAKYKDQALESRQAVMEYMVQAHYNQARVIIENSAQLVELAPDWVRDRYGLRSTADLLAELDTDEQQTLADLANITEASESQIAAWEEHYSKKWNELRERMNYLLISAPSIFYERVDRALERSGSGHNAVEQYLKNALDTINQHQESYQHYAQLCLAEPELSEGGDNKYDCAECRAMDQHKKLVDYGNQVRQQIQACQAIIADLDAMRPAVMSEDRPLSDAVAAGTRLEACLTELRTMHNPYVELVKLYQNRLDGQVWPCEQANN